MAIGDTIESRRLDLGWTQVELAQRAGVDPRQIRRYESGEAQPSIAVAQGIAKALRITLDELAGEAPGWNGLWWTSWDGLGPERISGVLELTHRGTSVEVRPAAVRHQTLDGESLRCDGNLLADTDSLVGWFDLRTDTLAARGTLQLARHGAVVNGAWVRLSLRQGMATGKVGFGRTADEADEALAMILSTDS